MDNLLRCFVLLLGIGILALNGWYLRKSTRGRRGSDDFDFDPQQDSYSKRRGESKLSFWIMLFGNAFALFIAVIVVMVYLTSEVKMVGQYMATHQPEKPAEVLQQDGIALPAASGAVPDTAAPQDKPK